MINRYDIAYGVGLTVASPFWLAKRSARKKVLKAFSQRMGHGAGRDLSKTAIMIHAVSLGEINATRALIEMLRKERLGIHFVVSVTTETGYARGVELYGSAADVTLVRYPLDFTPAVDRLLNALKPAVVVLMELEVWPNFIKRCGERGIPVVLINGRITEGSFRKYRMARAIVGGMFSRLTKVCAQDELNAERFVGLGTPRGRVSVTGTMKFDTAMVADRMEGQEELAAAVGIGKGERVWVCGSTGPGEEEIILPIFRRVREKFTDLRMVIVPRKPERFDEVAGLIEMAGFEVVRRSKAGAGGGRSAVILGDTIGELRKFYALAEIVFVGRTLVDLGSRQHGSDMMEPAALGKPVMVGTWTGNFADAMSRFLAAEAMVVVKDGAELEKITGELLGDPPRAKKLGERAKKVVMDEQGATKKHVDVVLEALDATSGAARAGGGRA